MFKQLRSRVPNVAVGVIVGLLVGGGVFAWAQTSANKPDDAGVHGGPKPRFHDASACNLVNVSTLEGNWTHGDYVKAVASSNPSKVRDAARSRCGKVVRDGGGAPRGGAGKDAKSQKDKARATSTPKPSPPAKSATPSATAVPSLTSTPAASATATPSSSETPSPTAS